MVFYMSLIYGFYLVVETEQVIVYDVFWNIYIYMLMMKMVIELMREGESDDARRAYTE